MKRVNRSFKFYFIEYILAYNAKTLCISLSTNSFFKQFFFILFFIASFNLNYLEKNNIGTYNLWATVA